MDHGAQASTVAGEPVWFGPARRPLLGFLHRPPDGTARAGVVICPPLGVERLSADRGVRRLAESLAAAGLLALRFDYDGTGDSAGDEQDPDRLQCWVGSVASAFRLLREAGAPALAAVGLRVGALLGALAGSADGSLDALVLWDPVASGRAFVREQEALRLVSIGSDPPAGATPPAGRDAGPAADGEGPAGSGPGERHPRRAGPVEILGSVLSPAVLAARARRELASIEGPVAKRVLAVVREERPPRQAATAVLTSWDAELLPVHGQSELVDALPDSSTVPEPTVEAITCWLVQTFTALRPATLCVPETLGDQAMVERDVLERTRRLGATRLFAIETFPVERASGPTVLFLNAGLIQHAGPSRLWVTLSRRLAASGLRAVRLDLSGLGESPPRPGQQPHLVYPPEALEDISLAVATLVAENPDGVVLSGLCSGAYHSIEGGMAPGVRGVVPINPWMSFEPEEVRRGGELAEGRSAVRPYEGWIQALLRFHWLADLGDRRAPAIFWWALTKLRLYSDPAAAIERLAGRGVRVLLICGDFEGRQFTRRARFTMRRLQRSGLVRLELLPGSDHTLFGAAARAQACEILLSYVGSTFGPGSSQRYEPAEDRPASLTAEQQHGSREREIDAAAVRAVGRSPADEAPPAPTRLPR